MAAARDMMVHSVLEDTSLDKLPQRTRLYSHRGRTDVRDEEGKLQLLMMTTMMMMVVC